MTLLTEVSERPVTARVIAAGTGVSEPTIYRLARMGVIPCVRLGRSVRFQPAEVAAVLARINVSDKEEA